MIGTISLGRLVLDIDSMSLEQGSLILEGHTVLRLRDDVPTEDTDIFVLRGKDGQPIATGIASVPQELKYVRVGDNIHYSQTVLFKSMEFV